MKGSQAEQSRAVNLLFLRRSRKKPEVGDVFVMRLKDGRNLPGRVVLADLPRGAAPMPGAYLVYVYRPSPPERRFDFAQMTPDELLIAPQFINRLGWARGYYETVANRPLAPEDLLPVHCFWDVTRRSFCDETGRILAARSEPCGTWTLGNYLLVDDLVSDALGIPRAYAEGGQSTAGE